MDNARIHHGEAIFEIADRFGKSLASKLTTFAPANAEQLSDVRVIYLPAYSPDFNPIEEAFSKIKHFIRRNARLMDDGDGIFCDMYCCMQIITPEDAMGYFIHAGYA